MFLFWQSDDDDDDSISDYIPPGIPVAMAEMDEVSWLITSVEILSIKFIHVIKLYI